MQKFLRIVIPLFPFFTVLLLCFHGFCNKLYAALVIHLQLLDEAQNWPDIKIVIKIDITKQHLFTRNTASQIRYYMSSTIRSVIMFNKYIRGHWAIENRPHWRIEVNFNQDLPRVRKGHAVQNLSTIRHCPEPD